MSVMTDRRSRAGGARDLTQGRMRRTPELVLAMAGIVLSLITMGGYTLVINSIDAATFEEAVMPALLVGAGDLPVDAAHELGRTLAAWFGVSLVIMLLLCAAGIALARNRPDRRTAGWWFLAAGIVCLVGSQLLLFPIAFLFFVSAGLFALRPLPGRSL